MKTERHIIMIEIDTDPDSDRDELQERIAELVAHEFPGMVSVEHRGLTSKIVPDRTPAHG